MVVDRNRLVPEPRDGLADILDGFADIHDHYIARLGEPKAGGDVRPQVRDDRVAEVPKCV